MLGRARQMIAATEAEMRGQVRGEFLFDAGYLTSDSEIHSRRLWASCGYESLRKVVSPVLHEYQHYQ